MTYLWGYYQSSGTGPAKDWLSYVFCIEILLWIVDLFFYEDLPFYKQKNKKQKTPAVFFLTTWILTGVFFVISFLGCLVLVNIKWHKIAISQFAKLRPCSGMHLHIYPISLSPDINNDSCMYASSTRLEDDFAKAFSYEKRVEIEWYTCVMFEINNRNGIYIQYLIYWNACKRSFNMKSKFRSVQISNY